MLEKLYFLSLPLIVIACNPSANYKSRAVHTVDASDAQKGFGQKFETEDELPACSKQSQNEIAFINSSKKIVVCQNNEWSDINLTNTGSSSQFDSYLNQGALPACDNSRENTIAYVFDSSSIMECSGGEWSEAKSLQGQIDDNYRIYETQELAGECNADRQGEFNFITSEKKFIHCQDSIWTDVDLSGEDGTLVSEAWRDVWSANVQSTVRISNVLTIYNNTDAEGAPNPAKLGNERCRLGSSGSGFIVDQDIIATNAHVANTWVTRSLASIFLSCGRNEVGVFESEELTFNRIFDHCIIPQLPVPNVTTIADVNNQTPVPLLSLINNTLILPSDDEFLRIAVQCYDVENRDNLAANIPFATISLRVRNQIEYPEGEANPVATRTLQIDYASSPATINPLLGSAQVSVSFPDAKGHIDLDTPTTPVSNLDMSVGGSDDLALLQAATGQRTPVTLSELDFSPNGVEMDGARLNEDVLLIGYSRGDTYAHFVTGNLNQTIRFDVFAPFAFIRDGFFTADDRILYMYDLVSGGGSSGSAIFNLAGEVIAYNFAGDTSVADTDFAYGLQVKHLRNLLAEDRNWMVPNTMPFLVRVP
ncbi:MAG: trypsin-like peptidase domain-containing protein [Oligoflexales bacterium]